MVPYLLSNPNLIQLNIHISAVVSGFFAVKSVLGEKLIVDPIDPVVQPTTVQSEKCGEHIKNN